MPFLRIISPVLSMVFLSDCINLPVTMPVFLLDSIAANRFFSQSFSATASLLKRAMYSKPFLTAYFMPRLTPPAKPALLLNSKRVTPGNLFLIILVELSCDPLSTTTISAFSDCFSRDSKHSAIKSSPFQLGTTIATLGIIFSSIQTTPLSVSARH